MDENPAAAAPLRPGAARRDRVEGVARVDPASAESATLITPGRRIRKRHAEKVGRGPLSCGSWWIRKGNRDWSKSVEAQDLTLSIGLPRTQSSRGVFIPLTLDKEK